MVEQCTLVCFDLALAYQQHPDAFLVVPLDELGDLVRYTNKAASRRR